MKTRDYLKIQLVKMTDLKKSLDNLCNDIGKDLCQFKVNVIKVENIVNSFDKELNCVADFGELELIEEKIDEMLYSYQLIKEKFKKGRSIRYNIEENEENCLINEV